MSASFVFHYAGALALTAALLVAVFYAARASARLRLRSTGRTLRIVESAMLSPGTMLHVVRMGESWYLVGGGNGHLALVDKGAAELDPLKSS